MKKLYMAIGVLCAILALLIGGSYFLDKQLGYDSSLLSDHSDNSRLKSKNQGAYSDMEVKEKEAKAKNVPEGKTDYEVIVTDIGEIRVDAKLTEEEWNSRIKLGLTSEAINKANKECSGLYYYDMLDTFDKQLYLEIYIGITNFRESFYICSLSPDSIDMSFNSMMADHPEIFYINGYLFTKYTAGDEIVKIEFTPGYTMTPQEAVEYTKEIAEYEKNFLKGISSNASDYEKIKYTYEYIILNTEYSTQAKENQNIISVFIFQKSVCQGYAKAFQYLLSKLNVKSTLIVGFIDGNDEGHAWNAVLCDGEYYYVDCTWGDSSYIQNSNKSFDKSGINYDYLNITTKELELTHVIDNFAPVPECVKTKDNYYVKEGLYFTKVDDKQLEQAFKNAKSTGKKSVEIKCSDTFVFDEMGTYLIDENHVFDYLDNKESLKYIKNQDLHIYSFPID